MWSKLSPLLFVTLKDKQRVEQLKQLLQFNGVKATPLTYPKIEEEWCSFHYLVQSSLKHVSEICMHFFYRICFCLCIY